MCQDCACGVVDNVTIHAHSHAGHSHNSAPDHTHTHPDPSHPEHTHRHNQAPDHTHHRAHHADAIAPHSHTDQQTHADQSVHSHNHTHTVPVHTALLTKNDRMAERNRGYFQAKGVRVLNVLSSPGSGKTALIERTARDLAHAHPPISVGVIVGDLATDNDAQRLRATGAPAVQITTGNACHLEADMISQAAAQLDLDTLQILVIENVGNLVCPAAYDLGEDVRVALLSVTEGEDKPLKYPTLFKSAQVVLISKVDIAEVVGFNRELAIANIRQIAPQATILEVSSRSGAGMTTWYDYLMAQLAPQSTVAQVGG